MSINEKKHLVYFCDQGLVEVTAEFKKKNMSVSVIVFA